MDRYFDPNEVSNYDKDILGEYRNWKNIQTGTYYGLNCLALAEENGTVFLSANDNKIKEMEKEFKVTVSGGVCERGYVKKEEIPDENWHNMQQLLCISVKTQKKGARLGVKEDVDVLYGLRKDGTVFKVPGNAPVAGWKNIIQLKEMTINDINIVTAIDIDGRIWNGAQTLGVDFYWGNPGRANEMVLFSSVEQLQEIRKKERAIPNEEKPKFSLKGLFGKKG